jgi:alkaline phosphatase D
MISHSIIRNGLQTQGDFNRRRFLAGMTALCAVPWLEEHVEGRTIRRFRFDADPFSLGVASGDPTSAGFVLWSRLAPRPLEPEGGLSREKIEVSWELASDLAMKNVVRRGTTVATPQLGHSVHVEIDGLEPDRWYWYRFRAGEATSPMGRARTMAADSAKPEQLRFAFASCQHYEQGLFTAYERMAQDDLDIVIHLGDYIYEYPGIERRVRKHAGAETRSLDDYRVRYAQYRADPHLQKMHARCPWIVTPDDHEVDNDYANAISEEKNVDPVDFLERRARAYQAYYEMMPLRKRSVPRGPTMRLYRSVKFGRLVEFQVLDTRQYRTDQPNGDRRSPLNEAALSARNSMLGSDQAGWLQSRLLESQATWNVLAQQVMMGMVHYRSSSGESVYSMDQWPGYARERIELVKFLAERRVPNPVVLTGDIHSNWVNDLRVDDRQAESPVVATEFVGTSISTGGNGYDKARNQDRLLSDNPGVRFHNGQRGYVRCTITQRNWRSEYQVVEQVATPGAPAITKAVFVVENGKAGATPA